MKVTLHVWPLQTSVCLFSSYFKRYIQVICKITKKKTQSKISTSSSVAINIPRLCSVTDMFLCFEILHLWFFCG